MAKAYVKTEITFGPDDHDSNYDISREDHYLENASKYIDELPDTTWLILVDCHI